ncbi:MAG: chorismate-binding protein, partial [Porticoccaceae bacterium]|nr:chorismate-binding protein [Porticoccaceae bacterium]
LSSAASDVYKRQTLVANNGKLHCWGGGGIVADSNAEDEYQESITKIALLMDTLSNESPHQL